MTTSVGSARGNIRYRTVSWVRAEAKVASIIMAVVTSKAPRDRNRVGRWAVDAALADAVSDASEVLRNAKTHVVSAAGAGSHFLTAFHESLRDRAW